jgi:phenylpyruvate tautomerase PptA (4-oxalocrotonate tautomerase family)
MRSGRTDEEIRALGDAIHRALIETCAVPPDDRFQVFTQHSESTLVYDRTFAGMDRSDGILMIEVTLTEGRPVAQKRAFFARAAELLEQSGCRPDDLHIVVREIGPDDWSLGRGVPR